MIRDDQPVSSLAEDYPLALSALCVAVAALLSGPVSFALTFLHPQPPWTDAATFAAHAHPVQQLAYWFGFGLLAACVMFGSRLAALAWSLHRTRAIMLIVLVAMYGAMITINYALQVAYVPQLARDASPSLGYVTMANALAPTWLLEMFGYGVLGVATWVAAPLFGALGRRRWIQRLLVANGVISVAGAVACGFGPGWVQTVPGLVAYLAWNAVFIAGTVLIAIEYRPRPVTLPGTLAATPVGHVAPRRRSTS